jgi:hypothetical protein
MKWFKHSLIPALLTACVLPGADFFPLREGNTWTYKEPVTGDTFSVRVGQPVTIAENVYYKLTGYTDAELLARVEPVYGTLVYWDDARHLDVLLTSFESFEGGYWYAPLRPCPDQAGQTQIKRITYDGPAGPVADVLDVRYRAFGCADVGAVQEQYAEHIGMLRRTQTSIAGPRTYDLISARIGSVTIDAASTVKFSVSVAPPAANGTIWATFRLQVSSAPLTLSFPSGQEYDFTLMDSAGNRLWTWSATASFIQQLHQRTVSDEWSATVEIPLAGVKPGDYSVQASVTTTGTPAFVGTAPVTIAGK